jgi:uncharacterized protein YdeI (YjbR/CyaY-like superfamily)
MSRAKEKRPFVALIGCPMRLQGGRLFGVQTAKKAETRAKRIKQFTEMLSQHKKIYP